MEVIIWAIYICLEDAAATMAFTELCLARESGLFNNAIAIIDDSEDEDGVTVDDQPIFEDIPPQQFAIIPDVMPVINPGVGIPAVEFEDDIPIAAMVVGEVDVNLAFALGAPVDNVVGIEDLLVPEGDIPNAQIGLNEIVGELDQAQGE